MEWEEEYIQTQDYNSKFFIHLNSLTSKNESFSSTITVAV